MTREQLEDAVNCKNNICVNCLMGVTSETKCIESCAQEALRQMDRAKRWEAVADTFYSMLKDPFWVPSTESYCASVDEHEYISAMSVYSDLKQEAKQG